MTRERDDPEKRNLLNEPKEEKKRRPYSVSKNKSDRHRSCDSSNNSEHRKRGGSYKISSTEQRAEFHSKPRSQSTAYQSENKNSWWFWTFVSQQDGQPSRSSEDTCSCGTCVLKKIISSEYTCVGGLLLLFTVSIIVAFLIVCKTVPSTQDCPCPCKKPTTTPCLPECKGCRSSDVDSERLKRKIEMLNNKKLEKGFVGVDEFRKNNDKDNDDGLGDIGVSGRSGIDFGPSFRELNSADDADQKLFNDVDLSNVLGSDLNLNNIDGSRKLREFYKKLVQTDAKIKSLKKMSESDAPYMEDDVLKSPERFRRSLKLFHSPKRYRVLRQRRSLFGKHQTNETGGTKQFGNRTRLKRFGDDSEEPSGFIIEKKKLLVQYKPTGKKRIPVKKCQHAPARTHTHEKQLMHPFYKNTQRLDILLDKFLKQNLPEVVSDPFGLDGVFLQPKLNKHCKHPKPHKNVNIISTDPLVDQIPKPKQKLNHAKNEKAGGPKTTTNNFEGVGGVPPHTTTTFDIFKLLNPESTTPYERVFVNHKLKMIDKVGHEKKMIVTPSATNFEVVMSISTIMNPDAPKGFVTTRATSEYYGLIPMKDRILNLRRLMQVKAGEEEENIGYEDFKEVLTDENENQNEINEPEQRKRRETAEAKDPKAHADKFKLANPPQGILNPNWKGAMPLYPDETNSMMTNKQMDVPKPTPEIQELDDGQRNIRDVSDVEYVEDYIASRYSNLVQQAQAYSDYGVLEGKKESRNEKEPPTVHTAPNHKMKLLADANVFKAGLLERLKRGRFTTTNFPKKIGDLLRGSNPRDEAVEKDIQIFWRAQTGSNRGKTKEGIRIQMQPTTKSRDDAECNKKIIKVVSKYVDLKPKPRLHNHKHQHGSILLNYPQVENDYSTKEPEITTEAIEPEVIDKNNEILVDMTRRRLLSTEFESSHDFRDSKDSTGYRGANRNDNSNSIDSFIDKLHMNKLSDATLALKEYIEGATEKNIKIYSTPQSHYPSEIVKSNKNLANDNANMVSKASSPPDQQKNPTVASNFERKAPPASIVTINKSLVKLGDPAPDNFFGKIHMLVNDPEFGQQHFNLMFDVPLGMNFKEELMMMNASMNYPNGLNQFDIFTDSIIDQQVTETNQFYSKELYQNRFKARRFKRDAIVTATWSDKSATGMSPEKDSSKASKVKVTVSIVPGNSSGSKSTGFADSSMGLSAAKRNISALNATSKTNRGANYNSELLAEGDNMTLSDFFAVVGNWFKALEYGKMDKPRKSSGSILADMLLTLNSSSMDSNVTSTDSAYPMYDSDMIENIGHRSRVLLSIEDGVVNVTDVKLVTIPNTVNVSDDATAVDGNVSKGTTLSSSTTAVVTGRRSNLTTTNKKKINKSTKISKPKRDKPRQFRAIVKRNADDSNLIFWDDIYDDEYGIRTDKMDKYMKSKINDPVVDKQIKKKDFLKRSGRWVQNKIRKFARKINPHSNAVASIHSDKERVSRSIGYDENFGLVDYPKLHENGVYNNLAVREKNNGDEIEEDYPDVDQKSLFAALSANMKEVCKKAAKAVQETRNVDNLFFNLNKNEVSDEESKQGSIASALMQQLVRLLKDLVDFQVQQKTCRKLTPELQTFLEWLTYPNDETEHPGKELVTEPQSDLLFKSPNQEEDKVQFPNAAKPEDRQEHVLPGNKNDYLDTLHSIQELMEEFDSMTDDEKSKMTGVKGYLEEQKAFLNNQMASRDLFAYDKNLNQFFDKYDRKKRNIYMFLRKTTKHRPRRKPQKFLKNFGRKHTRTTAAYNEEAQVTDRMINKKANENSEINHKENLHKALSKRNLKDVYYNAVAEAKKFSTAKRGPIHKKDEMSTFGTSTANRQH